KRSHGRTSEAPPDERGGNRYARPTATAPHSDSTKKSRSCSAARARVLGRGAEAGISKDDPVIAAQQLVRGSEPEFAAGDQVFAVRQLVRNCPRDSSAATKR